MIVSRHLVWPVAAVVALIACSSDTTNPGTSDIPASPLLDASAGNAAPDATPASIFDAGDSDSGSDASGPSGPVDGGPIGPTACPTQCVHGTCIASDNSCACDPGWSGTFCADQATSITAGTTVASSVAANTWTYFDYRGDESGVRVDVTEGSTVGAVSVYLAASRAPSQTDNLASDTRTSSASHDVTYALGGPSTTTWYVGVFGTGAGTTSFQLTLTSVP